MIFSVPSKLELSTYMKYATRTAFLFGKWRQVNSIDKDVNMKIMEKLNTKAIS